MLKSEKCFLFFVHDGKRFPVPTTNDVVISLEINNNVVIGQFRERELTGKQTLLRADGWGCKLMAYWARRKREWHCVSTWGISNASQMDWICDDVTAEDGPKTAATPFLSIWHTLTFQSNYSNSLLRKQLITRIPLFEAKWESFGGILSTLDIRLEWGKNFPFSFTLSSDCRKADSTIGSDPSNNPPCFPHTKFTSNNGLI